MLIDIMPDVLALVGESVDRVYRTWPESPAKGTYAVVEELARLPQLHDSEGDEVVTELSYGVALYGKDPDAVEDLRDAVVESLKTLRLSLSSQSPIWSTMAESYTIQCLFRTVVDRRGLTYR